MCDCITRLEVPEVEVVVEAMELDEEELGHRTDLSYLTPPTAPSIPPYANGIHAESVKDITFFEEDHPASQLLQTCRCSDVEQLVVAKDFMLEILEGNKENKIPIRIPEVCHCPLLIDLHPQHYFPYHNPKASSHLYPRGTIEGCSKFVSNHIHAGVPINS